MALERDATGARVGRLDLDLGILAGRILRLIELDSQLGLMFETAADVRMSHNFVRNAVLLFAFVVANDQCETARVAGGKADRQSRGGDRHLPLLPRDFLSFPLIGEW